jgi:hypothetical protein
MLVFGAISTAMRRAAASSTRASPRPSRSRRPAAARRPRRRRSRVRRPLRQLKSIATVAPASARCGIGVTTHPGAGAPRRGILPRPALDGEATAPLSAKRGRSAKARTSDWPMRPVRRNHELMRAAHRL